MKATLIERACRGGSGAVIRRNGDTVEKIATDEQGWKKIEAEAGWLQWVPTVADRELAGRFVRPIGIDERRRSFSMDWVSGLSARRLVLLGEADLPPLRSFICDTAVALVGLDSTRSVPQPDVLAWWTQQVADRLAVVVGRIPEAAAATQTRWLRMEGERVANPLRDLRLSRYLSPGSRFASTVVGPVHGDLHLGNVIRSGSSFVLVDPRGGFGATRSFDPAYDVAKLLHESSYLASVLAISNTHCHTAGDCLEVSHRDTDSESALALTRLSKFSVSIASSLASELAVRDPFVAARATLYVGLQLLTVLAFEAPRDWGLLLMRSASWIRAGQIALETRMTRHEIFGLWQSLASCSPNHSAWSMTAEETNRRAAL